jgi:hypothetical protein
LVLVGVDLGVAYLLAEALEELEDVDAGVAVRECFLNRPLS